MKIDPKDFVVVQGERVAVEVIETASSKKRRHEPFAAPWVKLPRLWIEQLGRTRSINTRRLADIILLAAFEGRPGREIVLSWRTVPGMHRNCRTRAAMELRDLGLIAIAHNGRRALRVTLTEAGARDTSRRK